jgi:hypothetical protein
MSTNIVGIERVSSAIRPKTCAWNWCHVPQPSIGWWTR